MSNCFKYANWLFAFVRRFTITFPAFNFQLPTFNIQHSTFNTPIETQHSPIETQHICIDDNLNSSSPSNNNNNNTMKIYISSACARRSSAACERHNTRHLAILNVNSYTHTRTLVQANSRTSLNNQTNKHARRQLDKSRAHSISCDVARSINSRAHVHTRAVANCASYTRARAISTSNVLSLASSHLLV